MVLVTTFLLVLIGALLIGNALLYIFGPKEEGASEQSSSDGGMQPALRQVSFSAPNNDFSGQQVNLAPLTQKVELAHKRIQVIEKSLVDAQNPQFDITLKRKVEKLDNFRSTIEAEMVGMKEILQELQNNHITAKSRKFEKSSKETTRKFSVYNKGSQKAAKK